MGSDCNGDVSADLPPNNDALPDLYDRLAPFYDLGMDGYDDDTGLYLGFAQRSGASVLELGCGTGRLLLPLAEAGFQAIGLDRSAAMLGRARDRLAGEPHANVRLAQADMARLPLTGRFGLIFVALDGFLHLTTLDQQLACLRSAQALLGRDGLLILDLPNLAAGGWEDWSPGVRPIVLAWTRLIEDGSRVSKFSSFTADASTQTHRVTEIYEQSCQDGAVRRWTVEYTLRFVFPAELELLLAAAGLQLLDRYGDYDLGPFTGDGARQICVAGRARGARQSPGAMMGC